MALSSLFTKFKGLGPVVIVGGAVIITIKLLTTQTPNIQESFNVDAQEDIAKTNYEEQIEEPKPEEQAPPEEEEQKQEAEAAPQEKQEKDSESEEESEDENGDENPDENEEKKKKEDEADKKEEKPKGARSWIPDTKRPEVAILKRLLAKQ